uniref:Kelch repeat protein n=1 Tax=Parascaris equorum TaxID=6256 RepID=A0A914S5E3_PAREQ
MEIVASSSEEVCPLTNKRSALGAAVVNERLYVCGGYDGISSLSSVEVYNAITDRWSMTTPMHRLRSAAGIAVIDNYIYGAYLLSVLIYTKRYITPVSVVFGGSLYDGCQFLKSVEVYDPDKDQWSPLSPMHLKRSRVSLVSNAGELVVPSYNVPAGNRKIDSFESVGDLKAAACPYGKAHL